MVRRSRGARPGSGRGTPDPWKRRGSRPREEESRFGVGPPERVLQWLPELTVGALPCSYQDILEVLEGAVHPMRAHPVRAALGLSTDKTEELLLFAPGEH